MNDFFSAHENVFIDWPHANASQFVNSAGYRWHVQVLGSGPEILLIHGTGASTHSWAKLVTLLTKHFKVISIDLPGHGFTEMPTHGRLTLSRIASDIAILLKDLKVAPPMVIGHSAGAAILVEMSLCNLIQPKAIVSINGALLPLRGFAGHFFSPAAKLLANLPFIPKLFVSRANKDPKVAKRMVEQTGSTLNDEDIEKYQKLLKSQKHVNAALQMMANWNLDSIGREFSKLQANLYLLACENDKTVSMNESKRISTWSERAYLETIPNLGHLGHEEDPKLFYELIMGIVEREKLINI